MGGNRSRGDVKDGGGKLSCYFKHIRNHQQKSLGSSKSGGKSSCLKCPVNSTSGPCFTLHFNHLRYGSPEIFFVKGAPSICPFAHGRRWSNGVNCYDFT